MEALGPVLQATGLNKSFGALRVAENIDLCLRPGDRHALIGPNGAGKTTLVNILTGRTAPSSGSILLDRVDITRASQRERVRRGLVRTFQINTIFRGLSALENVTLAVAERTGAAANGWSRAYGPADAADEAFGLLEALGLAADALRPVQDLPYGRQRLVEIALALGLKPRVLLLDEPAAGVSSAESDGIISAIEALSTDIAILMIDHDMDLVFRFAKRITVLVRGAVLMEGEAADVAADRRVRETYLGLNA